MSYRGLTGLMSATVALGVLALAVGQAQAGGFALREQSSYGQGSSFAGMAAGGDLSSMFWNPATMTQVPGIQTESVLTGIIPSATHTVNSGTFAPYGGAGDSANDALLPAGYASWQVNSNLWLGLSVNSPYGLSVSFPDTWAGRNYGGDTSLKSYNFTPSIAYKVNDWLSVGGGVQIQYAKADLATGLPINGFGLGPGLTNQASVSGSGWGYGFTLGVTLTPTPTTLIGIGYRSAINQKINGTLTLPSGPAFTPAAGSTPGSVSTTLNLPAVLTFGLRQKLAPQWTALGTVEWTNWSRIGTAKILQADGSAATIVGTPVTLPFQYSDSWFFSVGAEYQWNPQLAVRAGVGYEKSPVTDGVRTPRLPDNDRIWLSLGATYQMNSKVSFDFAYSHIFVKDTSIDITSGHPWFNGVSYVGSVDSHVDIVSVALKYRWDTPETAPVRQVYAK